MSTGPDIVTIVLVGGALAVTANVIASCLGRCNIVVLVVLVVVCATLLSRYKITGNEIHASSNEGYTPGKRGAWMEEPGDEMVLDRQAIKNDYTDLHFIEDPFPVGGYGLQKVRKYPEGTPFYKSYGELTWEMD